jgi:hypothetical protein
MNIVPLPQSVEMKTGETEIEIDPVRERSIVPVKAEMNVQY